MDEFGIKEEDEFGVQRITTERLGRRRRKPGEEEEHDGEEEVNDGWDEDRGVTDLENGEVGQVVQEKD